MYADLKAQLPSLIEAIKVGAEYGGDLAHRFILFDIWSNALWLGVLLASSTLSFFVTYKAWVKSEWRLNNDPANLHAVIFIFGVLALGLLLIIDLIVIPVNINAILKGIFIPEIRIVELLSSLIN